MLYKLMIGIFGLVWFGRFVSCIYTLTPTTYVTNPRAHIYV